MNARDRSVPRTLEELMDTSQDPPELSATAWKRVEDMPIDKPVLGWTLLDRDEKLSEGDPAIIIKKSNGEICHYPEDHFSPAYVHSWAEIKTPPRRIR